MLRTARPAVEVLMAVGAAAVLVVAVWVTSPLIGWTEDGVIGWIPESSSWVALVIVVLLVADTVLPIPGTILMLASGALLGPVTGSAINAAGLTLAALLGYCLGKTGRGLAFRRKPSVREYSFAAQPMWIIAATRGLPVLSESFAIAAGALGFPFARFIRAAGVGAVAVGAVYSVAGSLAMNHWSLVIPTTAMAGAAYLLARRSEGSNARRPLSSTA